MSGNSSALSDNFPDRGDSAVLSHALGRERRVVVVGLQTELLVHTIGNRLGENTEAQKPVGFSIVGAAWMSDS